MDGALAAYLIVVTALVASPGPDSILIIRNTLASGRAPGALTVAGVQAGVSLHALLSVIGLSALVYYSPAAFRALALAGALYLALLGALTIKHGIVMPAASAAAKPLSPRRAFMQGLLCNLLNPKVIVLFVALMPTFIIAGRGDESRQLITLALLLLAVNIPFQIGLVLAAARMHRFLSSGRGAVYVQWALGGALIIFAIALFSEHVIHLTADSDR